MASIDPSPEQLAHFLERADAAGPIVMLNLLRYRERAEYPPGTDASACSGREAYARYATVALVKVAAVGGRFLWMGSASASLIGPDTEAWDDVALVEYPSRQAFLQMVAMADYQAAVVHRSAALMDSRLIPTRVRLDVLSTP
jgi:uncharacterized protein (DUF1330 family)